eukprot:COSAG04_NODE_15264_length_537_cov_1.696347_1_plen_73_part_10
MGGSIADGVLKCQLSQSKLFGQALRIIAHCAAASPGWQTRHLDGPLFPGRKMNSRARRRLASLDGHLRAATSP